MLIRPLCVGMTVRELEKNTPPKGPHFSQHGDDARQQFGLHFGRQGKPPLAPLTDFFLMPRRVFLPIEVISLSRFSPLYCLRLDFSSYLEYRR